MTKKKLLVVGQTPPPYHGQAIMIQHLLGGTYSHIQIYHARMAFSQEISEVGNCTIKKLWQLIRLVCTIYYYRLCLGVKNLYYPPAGGNRNPILRDIVILLLSRFLFKKIIFHYHAAGLTDYYSKLPAVVRFLYRLAYFRADLAILVSANCGIDSEFLHTKKQVIIPNAVEDISLEMDIKLERYITSAVTRLLYVGLLVESKGIIVLLAACKILKQQGHNFQLRLVGEFKERQFADTVSTTIAAYEIESEVRFSGRLVGKDKDKAYRDADIFCFPTYYENEVFGIVLLEAMRSALPVVATSWRGTSEIIVDGKSGYLVNIRDAVAFADKLALLIGDPERRIHMGLNARNRYRKLFSLSQLHRNFEAALHSVCV